MKVKRIVANVGTSTPEQARRFYGDILGLDIVMDQGWIVTYGSPEMSAVQISFAVEGGSGTAVPNLSIEVDDLDELVRRLRKAKVAIEYGPVVEPWGVRRLFVRDPFGNLVNILAHQ